VKQVIAMAQIGETQRRRQQTGQEFDDGDSTLSTLFLVILDDYLKREIQNKGQR